MRRRESPLTRLWAACGWEWAVDRESDHFWTAHSAKGLGPTSASNLHLTRIASFQLELLTRACGLREGTNRFVRYVHSRDNAALILTPQSLQLTRDGGAYTAVDAVPGMSSRVPILTLDFCRFSFLRLPMDAKRQMLCSRQRQNSSSQCMNVLYIADCSGSHIQQSQTAQPSELPTS